MHPLPYTIGLEQTVDVAIEMLREHGIRHLPVCRGGVLCGVLSDRDVEFALRVDHAEPKDLLVKDCYTADPYVVEPATPLVSVAAHMASERIGCALVAEHGRVVGIFTTVDACGVLASLLSSQNG